MSAIDGIEEIAVIEWSRELSGLSGAAIRYGLDAWKGDWAPGSSEFARLCREYSCGAPNSSDAWRIICNARGMPGTLQERYKHPAVLEAASSCDIFAWSQLSEREGLSRFAPHYRKILNRVDEGEDFCWNTDKTAIEDRAGKAITDIEKAEAKYRRKKLIRRAMASVGGKKLGVINNWQMVHGMRYFHQIDISYSKQ